MPKIVIADDNHDVCRFFGDRGCDAVVLGW